MVSPLLRQVSLIIWWLSLWWLSTVSTQRCCLSYHVLVLPEIWAISGILMCMLGLGVAMGFTTSLLPALDAPDSPIKADLTTKAWLTSLVGVGGMFGFVASSILMDIFGRRVAHFLVLLPTVLGWLLIYISKNVLTLLIGRLLTGFGAGATVLLGSVVIGEFSSPVYRGTFLNLKTAAVCLGGMVTHILGHFITWRAIALVTLAPLIAALCIIYTWPESPAWLASKQQFKKSEEAFFWLRGKDERSIKELEGLIKSQMNQTGNMKSFKEKVIYLFKKFTRRDFLMPLFICCMGMLMLEVSGRHFFPAFALKIMEEVTGSKSSSFYYTLAMDLIITSSATFSSYLVKIMRRRTLLFVSGIAAIVFMFGACTYLFLASRGVISKEHSWIPISLFVAYFITVNLGCTPLPLAFLGELFPLEHRGVGSTLAGIFSSLFLNLTLQVTPFLLIGVKVYGTFAIFGTCMAVLLVVFYFTLPETKDRTLQEIEFFFNNGRFEVDQVYSKVNVTMRCKAEA